LLPYVWEVFLLVRESLLWFWGLSPRGGFEEFREEFQERLKKAVEGYEAARGLYERVAEETGVGWALCCGAFARYLEHWIVTDPSEKKRLLDECLVLERDALEAFWDGGDKLQYCRTYGELPELFFFKYHRTEDRQARKKILEEGIKWGEKAVASLSEIDDSYEIARSHFNLATCLTLFQHFMEEPEKRWHQISKATEHFQKTIEFSERVGDKYLVGLSYLWLAAEIYAVGEKAIEYNEKALKRGEETKDNYLKGSGLLGLAFNAGWRVRHIEDPDEGKKVAEESIKARDRAMHHLSIFSYFADGGFIYVNSYQNLANLETDLEKRREILDRSLEIGTRWLKVTEDPINGFRQLRHSLSRALTSRASLEPDLEKRKSMLKRALEYRELTIEHGERFEPFHYWDRGIRLDDLAKIKEQLAYLETDHKTKIGLLKEIVLTRENGLQHLYKWMPFAEKRGSLIMFARLNNIENDHATLLTRLHELTKEPELVRKTIETLWKSIESASKLNLCSRIAEAYWKIAKAQDVLEEHLEAAENFLLASENYMKAAEKIPQLISFYKDHATYMQAWSEIEKARQHHTEKHYGKAKEHYEKAAELHKSTERWSYLVPNYLAWTRLEQSEDLSRKEKTEEAMSNFDLAANLFLEARDSILAHLEGIEVGEEKETAQILVEASGLRRDYCLGRVALEEGRTLDRQGDHLASSRRYGQAAERFQNLIETMERESDRREIQQVVYLCKAWEMMMMAEARTSPGLYNNAAELFEQARKHALDQPTSLLAQAHSSFCSALEAGTRFEINRDPTLFSIAKNHIEAATNHYLRAGHQSSSDYATATNRLLDAYMYTYNAQTETDPSKKARFYQLAERLLQDSAGLFLKAKHPEKSDEVRTILENIKGEKQIAITLAELMHAPTFVSTTTSFSTPTPTHERANGLERFENADIQANIILGRRDVKVGDDIDIEIELVNAGKAPAQLIKIEEIIPEGFEVSSAPDICRVEDSYLDMKGRTLNPLKTAELKIVLRPLDKGTYNLKPRVLYLDEAGKYRSHEPDPATVVVKELGIKGWIRGPTR